MLTRTTSAGRAGVAWLALLAALGITCGGATTSEPGTASRTYCAKRCATTADCCPAGLPGCPGAYPENFECSGGLCRAPRCEKDADCTFGTKPACRALHGLASCVRACAADADCDGAGGLGAASACNATSDDGQPICGLAKPLCQSDADCLVPGLHCLGMMCGCSRDADCSGSKLTRCAAGVCSCASDAECGPSLGACTGDPAFAYPPSAAPGTK